MAVRVLPAGTIGIPLNPIPAPEPPPLEVEDDVPTLHLVGRSEQRLAQALFETEAVDEERDAEVAALTVEVDTWRGRALDEHAQRGAEQREAVRRERELVTVLHSELIRNETLSGELAWRRKPWFRRIGRH